MNGTLEVQCFITGLDWLKSAKCWRISLDVMENEASKMTGFIGEIEKWKTVTFSAPKAAPGVPPEVEAKRPGMITEKQVKRLWVLFGNPVMIEHYGSRTKEEAEIAFKKKTGIEHLRDMTEVSAEKSIEAMDKYIRDVEEAKAKEKGGK